MGTKQKWNPLYETEYFQKAVWNTFYEYTEYTEEKLVAPGLPIKTWNNHSLFDFFIS